MGVTGKPSVRWDLSSGERDMAVLFLDLGDGDF